MNTKKKQMSETSAKSLFAHRLPFMCLFLFLYTIGLGELIYRNPDNDAYFLIENGRYIVENGRPATTVYWSFVGEFPTVIQQWLCSLLNYIAYSIGGFKGTVILAVILYTIFCATIMTCLYLLTKDLSCTLLTTSFMLVFAAGFLTSRPYSITISISIGFVYMLWKYYRQEDKGEKQRLLLYLKSAIFFFIQANWQAASIVFLLAWTACFAITIKNEKPYIKINNDFLWAGIFGIIASCFNPNGIKSLLYLINSGSSLNIYPIAELGIPSVRNLFTFLMIGLVLFFSRVRKKLPQPVIFMFIGSIVGYFLAFRLCWMLYIPTIFSVELFKDDIKKYAEDNLPKIVQRLTGNVATIVGIVGSVMVLMDFVGVYNMPLQATEIQENIQTLIPAGEKIYTDFNTGGMFLLSRYKIYMDARPELYGKNIAGDMSILEESYEVYQDTDCDYEVFREKYDLKYFAITKDKPLDIYMKHNENYKLLYDSKAIYKDEDKENDTLSGRVQFDVYEYIGK
jgi:hypothetical protein